MGVKLTGMKEWSLRTIILLRTFLLTDRLTGLTERAAFTGVASQSRAGPKTTLYWAIKARNLWGEI